MQIGGLGSKHSTSDHHVTNCIHDHHEIKDTKGGAAMKASASSGVLGDKAGLVRDGRFSLSAWVRNMLGNGRGFLLNFWGEGQADGDGVTGGRTGAAGAGGIQPAASQALVNTGDCAAAEKAVMAAHVTMQPQVIHNNPHFPAAEETGNQKRTLLQKVKVRLRNVSGQLSGRFRTKNSFQAKQERPREDLPRQSRYRKDTVEINCVLTEDSYLMDSYDRKGEYSKLTTKK